MNGNELCEMHDLFTKYAPTGVVLLDFIERHDEYIVFYRDEANVCTPYIIHHLNSNGLYWGHYYSDKQLAMMDFSKMR